MEKSQLSTCRVNKNTHINKLDERLQGIRRSNGFKTDLGLRVDYGIDQPEWRNHEGLQFIDQIDSAPDTDSRSHCRDLTVIVSACGYGKRAELKQVGQDIEADVLQILGHCCTSQASVLIEKELRESGEQSSILITFTVELKINALPSSRR